MGLLNNLTFRLYVPDYDCTIFKVSPVIKPKAKELTLEEYICRAFGKDCKLALAVSQAENGTRQCDRMNVNTNKTVDIGIFQINTVHLKKGYTLSDLIDCKKNVDIAYKIYKQQGFAPWVAYTNKSYRKFLTK